MYTSIIMFFPDRKLTRAQKVYKFQNFIVDVF